MIRTLWPTLLLAHRAVRVRHLHLVRLRRCKACLCECLKARVRWFLREWCNHAWRAAEGTCTAYHGRWCERARVPVLLIRVLLWMVTWRRGRRGCLGGGRIGGRVVRLGVRAWGALLRRRPKGRSRCPAVQLRIVLRVIRIRLAGRGLRIWLLKGCGRGGELARIQVVMGRAGPAKDGFVCGIAFVGPARAHGPVHGGQGGGRRGQQGERRRSRRASSGTVR